MEDPRRWWGHLRWGRLGRNSEELVGQEESRVHNQKGEVMPAVRHPVTPTTETYRELHGS